MNVDEYRYVCVGTSVCLFSDSRLEVLIIIIITF